MNRMKRMNSDFFCIITKLFCLRPFSRDFNTCPHLAGIAHQAIISKVQKTYQRHLAVKRYMWDYLRAADNQIIIIVTCGNKIIMSKLLLIIIDGCRPDAINRERCPNIMRLVRNGSHTFNARTVTPSITLPVHFSIVTSMTPTNHGVITNTGRPLPSSGAIGVFELAACHGLTTAAFLGWDHLRELFPPGVLNFGVTLHDAVHEDDDLRLARMAVDHLREARPHFCLLYLGRLDLVGHRSGFMSEDYLNTLGRADEAAGLVLDALDEFREDDSYTVFLMSDHGGSGFDHSEPLPEVMTVPLVAAGPGIKRGFTIDGPVNVIDVAPTMARVMNICPPPLAQGRALDEIFLEG